MGRSQDELATTAEYYKHLRDKKRRNKQELLAYTQFKYRLEQCKIDLKVKVEEIAINAGAEGLLSALETGLIEVQIFELGADNAAIVNEFFNSIKDAILSGRTHPLFDDSTGQLVNAAVKEGKLVLPNTSASRAKQIGLSSNLLNRLPLFDDTSVDEIVDIRKELNKPLVHFRSAIIKFSKEIESLSWEREFPQEVEQVFHEHVAPAVLEIEEACKSNKLLNSLVHNFGSKSLVIPGTSAFGFLISKAIDLPDIVTQSIALAVGASTVGWEAVREWREKNQEIERNQLYFYYRVGKQLSR